MLMGLVMWTPIIRSIIQFYLITCIGIFTYIRDYEKIEVSTLFIKVFEIFSVVAFPFMYKLIKANQNLLHTQEYI